MLLVAKQRAKEVVFDSLRLVDFAIGLMNSVLNLPDGQVIFLGEFKLQKNCNQSCLSNFFRLVGMTFNVHDTCKYSLPK